MHLLFCHVVLESFSLEMSVDHCSFQDFFKASQGWKFGNFRALFCFFQLFWSQIWKKKRMIFLNWIQIFQCKFKSKFTWNLHCSSASLVQVYMKLALLQCKFVASFDASFLYQRKFDTSFTVWVQVYIKLALGQCKFSETCIKLALNLHCGSASFR